MSIRTYSPKNVTVTWGGKYNFTGLADGTFVTMQRNSARTDVVIGAKGDNAITKIADTSGTVELVLLQNSKSNEYLTYLMNAEDSTGELIRANIQVLDPSGASLSIAHRCHIQEPAPTVLGDGQNAKTWTFHSEDIQYLAAPDGLAQEDVISNVADVYGALSTVSDNISSIIN